MFLLEEDTDLADPNHQSPGRKKQPRPKPGSASKVLDENITTDKTKAGGGGRDFPGKPSDDIIDLDSTSSPSSSLKKTPVGGKALSETSSPTLPRPQHPGSNQSREDYAQPSTVPPSRSHTPKPRSGSKIVTAEDLATPTQLGTPAGTAKITPKDGDIVQGSDNKMYRVLKGPRGPTGPYGKPVSLCLSPSSVAILLTFAFMFRHYYK